MRSKMVGSGAAATEPAHPEWSQLLIDAVTKPGIISNAYSRFWNYSIRVRFTRFPDGCNWDATSRRGRRRSPSACR
jgi:hypothetical protein